MRIEDTAGNVAYIIPYCDCGLTGGCEKCQPLHMPEYNAIEYVFPEEPKNIPLGPALERFYKKKGYF